MYFLGGIVVISVIALVYTVWSEMINNQIQVKPGGEEAKVIRHPLSGAQRVIKHGGAYPLMPGWTEGDVVRTNARSVDEKDMDVKTKDEVRVLLDFQCIWTAGHKLVPMPGQVGWYESDGDPLKDETIDEETILSAVNSLNSEDEREKQVKQALHKAFEMAFNLLTVRDVMKPGGIRFPTRFPGVAAAPIQLHTELCLVLAKMIVILANRDLFKFGIQAISVQITNVRYKSEKTQEAVEEPTRRGYLADAVAATVAGLTKAGTTLEPQEIAAYGTEAFADALKATGQRKGDEAKGAGLTAIGHGLEVGLPAIADAIKLLKK